MPHNLNISLRDCRLYEDLVVSDVLQKTTVVIRFLFYCHLRRWAALNLLKKNS